MNEELVGKLGNIVDIIARGMTTVGDFVMAELPDVVRQYVLYGRVSEIVWTLILGVILGYAIYTLFHKGFYNKTDLDVDPHVGVTIGSVVAIIIFTIPFLHHLQALMLVWFAPKIWLLQEVAGLIRSVKGK